MNDPDASTASDGDHTIDALCEDRAWLWLTLCRVLQREAEESPYPTPRRVTWRSWRGPNGLDYAELFFLGLRPDRGPDIIYHLPARLWPETAFAETLVQAPRQELRMQAAVVAQLRSL